MHDDRCQIEVLRLCIYNTGLDEMVMDHRKCGVFRGEFISIKNKDSGLFQCGGDHRNGHAGCQGAEAALNKIKGSKVLQDELIMPFQK